MLTTEERAELQQLLAHAVNPAEAMTLEQLEGYLFGLAITPDVIQPIEWFLDIFGEAFAEFADTAQANDRVGCLIRVYNRLNELRLRGQLIFPFDFDEIDPPMLEHLRGWVAGLDRALALRSYIWMPDEVLEQEQMSREDEQIMLDLMVVLGVAQPEKIPEIFEGEDDLVQNRDEAWAQLVGQLPAAVTSLIERSAALEASRVTADPVAGEDI